MKQKLLLVLVLLAFFSTPIQAQKGRFWKSLGRAVGEVLAGATDTYINTHYDQKTVENWRNISSEYIPQTYNTDAGRKLANGDYAGAARAALSSGAVTAGVDEKVVALGNSGVTNWLNGDKDGALVDVAQMGAHIAAGSNADQFDYLFESKRQINQINQEYRLNINNGMSREEADKIKNEKLGSVIGNAIFESVELDKQKKQEERMRQKKLQEGLVQRGYSENEAIYISSFIEKNEPTRNEDGTIMPVDEVLNLYHVCYKTPSENNSFFGTIVCLPKDSIKEPSIKEKELEPEHKSESKTMVNELEKTKQLIEKTVVNNYEIGCTSITDIQKKDLECVTEKLKQFENIHIVIVGHTCNIGSLEKNQQIGKQRAQNVKQYLLEQGISENRIQVESRNFSEPVVDNDNEEHRKQNRRVTFKIK